MASSPSCARSCAGATLRARDQRRDADRAPGPRPRHHRDVTLPLAPGLNVLTGETGAGKSMIVGALGLLLGERAPAAPCARAPPSRWSKACSRHRAANRRAGRRARDSTWTTARRGAARGLRRGPLARLGERQPHHRRRARRAGRTPGGPARPARDAVAAAPRCAARHARRLRRAGAGPVRRGRGACHRRRGSGPRSLALAARRDEVRRRADYLRHVVTEIDAAEAQAGRGRGARSSRRGDSSQAGTLVGMPADRGRARRRRGALAALGRPIAR